MLHLHRRAERAHRPRRRGWRWAVLAEQPDHVGLVTLFQHRGQDITMEVELITPIAMEKELRFAIREGGRTVGAGRVVKINK